MTKLPSWIRIVGAFAISALVAAMMYFKSTVDVVEDGRAGVSATFVAEQSLADKDLDQLNIDVRMLFAEKCYKCHNSTKHKAALILDTKEGIFEGGENGPILTAGSSDQSEIIRRIKLSGRNEDAMPPEGDRLSRDEVALVERWIDEGAHWVDTTLKLFREAPLALVKPTLPSDSQFGHPIDIFVDKYFDQKSLRWPSQLEDHRFIRKVYLDVIGLLPSSEIIESFAADRSEGKYEQVVTRLLDDKENYTLHWLSFWNDLLRNDYTGTGYITGGRKQITDWLYKSLRENKPYDQFVRELVNPSEGSEGFIAGIEWRGVVNASQRTELQAAQNISQSLLGINLKCASCHNSFVNNVSLDQAYAFANVFADSVMEVFQCDKPTGRFANTSFLYPELGEVAGDSLIDRLNALSDIMVVPENGRLYRTIVNRYWQRLLGRGMVGSVDDMDQMPWSQELLDWLAMDFVEHGYDLKHLLKTILTSKTYRLQGKPYENVGQLDGKNFVFEGPVPRRLTAEQFVDAFATTISPFYNNTHFITLPQDGDAQWVWHKEIESGRQVLPKPGTRWFRRVFEVEDTSRIKEVELLVSADSAINLYLNGEEIAIASDWRKVVRKRIAPSAIQRLNCISAEAQNDGIIANPAGILLTMAIYYEDRTDCIETDTFWVSTDTFPGNEWHDYHFQDSSWQQIVNYGRRGYWGYLTDFRFGEKEWSTARAAIVAKDPFTLSLGRPTRENVATKREEESTLLQAMTLSNDEKFSENIRRGALAWNAQYSADPRLGVENLFYKLVGRVPTKKEISILTRDLEFQVENQGWEDVIWAILMLPEFNLI